MIDSVLKGTGNSRFLKSAVPAGTSWADALAMLQAGTFPIDFNGINTEGFQQVGTPLNKANLLKDATAAQIGLPPSTTPDEMFRALGNTGELHVWRKTVVNSQAGYNIGEVEAGFLGSGQNTDNSNCGVTFKYSNSISVSDDGNVQQNSATSQGPFSYNSSEPSTIQNLIRGKFVSMIATTNATFPSAVKGGVWYIPADANVSLITNGTSLGYPYNMCYIVDKMQEVQAYGARTTTTYPVSTNPNAYQEGDDAKAAGYVVGEVKTGRFQLEGYYNSSHPTAYYWADAPTVSDDGVVSIPSGSPTVPGYGFGESSLLSSIRGKYLQCIVDNYTQGDFRNLGVVYIPEDVVVLQYNSAEGVYIDRYQPVTGYAAIPAGTTIEYLGKLVDKARLQVVSYVGTGTYGSSNPNSLTFDFVPKIVVIQSSTENSKYGSCIVLNGTKQAITYPSTDYASEFSWNKKTVSWYNQDGSDYQLNKSNAKYTAVAIG